MIYSEIIYKWKIVIILKYIIIIIIIHNYHVT